jgi:hypothetical protein
MAAMAGRTDFRDFWKLIGTDCNKFVQGVFARSFCSNLTVLQFEPSIQRPY